MEAGKCEDKKAAKKCMKTCEKCEDDDGGEGGKCKDKMPAKICKKIKKAGKCDKNADKCMKTCDFCDDDGSGSGKLGSLNFDSVPLHYYSVLNKPGVAGAVLQTLSLLID